MSRLRPESTRAAEPSPGRHLSSLRDELSLYPGTRGAGRVRGSGLPGFSAVDGDPDGNGVVVDRDGCPLAGPLDYVLIRRR